MLEGIYALKIINQVHTAEPSAVQRFQNEAVLLSSIKHPNIVAFQAFGQAPDSRFYMVLEYLEGKTLADLLKEKGKLPIAQALPLFMDILRGLSAAHQKGVVHRDIKPSNIMICNIDGQDTAKILDFGLLKSTQAEAQNLTKTGQFLGSVNYMSPEQCQRQTIDLRSDIYSVGILMYETLIGSPPMQDANDLLILSNHVHKEISSLPSGIVPKDIENAIIKCLQKDPAKRFSSAEELANKLSAARLSEPFVLRSKFISFSIAALVLLIGAAASWAFIQSNQSKGIVSEPEQRRRSRKGEARPLVEKLSTERKYQVLVEWLDDNYDYQHVNAAKMAEIWLSAFYLGQTLKDKPIPPHGDDCIKACQREIEDPHKVKLMKKRDYYNLIYSTAEIFLRQNNYGQVKETTDLLLRPLPLETDADTNYRMHKYYSRMANYADSVKDNDLRRDCTLKDVECSLKDNDIYFLRHDYAWLTVYYSSIGDKDKSHQYGEKLVAAMLRLKTIIPDEGNFPEMVLLVIVNLKEAKQLSLICKLYDDCEDSIGLTTKLSKFDPLIYGINLEAARAFEMTGNLSRSLSILKELQHYSSQTNQPKPELERQILTNLHKHGRDKEIMPTLLSFLSSIEKHWPMVYIDTLRIDEMLINWKIDDKQLWQNAYAMAQRSQNNFYEALVWRLSAEFAHYKHKDKEALALINQSFDYFSKFENYDDDRQAAYSVKAMILESLGKNEEAKQVLREGLQIKTSSLISRQQLETQLQTITH